MNYALAKLLENPQNNLRIFKDGHLVFDENNQQGLIPALRAGLGSVEDSSVLSDFLSLLSQALLHCENKELRAESEQNSCDCGYGFKHTGDTRFDENQCQLPINCILGSILKVQKLDDIDIEGITQHYNHIQHSKLSQQSLNNFLYTATSLESCQETSVTEALLKVKNFLTSTTAKDCSILIALQRYSGNSFSKDQLIFSPQKIPFVFRAGIVDLDPKPHERIPGYLIKERDFAQEYLTSL